MTDSRILIEGLSHSVSGFCTTRHNGVSVEPFDSLNLAEHVGDDQAHVLINRQRLAQWLPQDPVWVEQVHGVRVLDARALPDPSDRQADALVTTVPGQVLGILTADCMAVVMADDAGRALGVAHAGWRGLAAGVLQATAQAMEQASGQGLGAWRAWIGPCIGAAAFQVGEEVREAFVARDAALQTHFVKDAAPHKWRCNMPGIAQDILRAQGAQTVSWCGLCTVEDERQRFFSYRRSAQTGRMATVAWINDH